MKKEIEKILKNSYTNYGEFDESKATKELLNLFSVSNCECKNLPKGEIAISSKALTDPNWKS